MPTEPEIYTNHAAEYERLVQREDYQNNLLEALEAHCTLEGSDVVELGAGTGRLTHLLLSRVRSISAFDLSRHMLASAESSLRVTGFTNWITCVADHRKIPVEKSIADLVISGWSFCYLAVWSNGDWRSSLQEGLAEIRRVLRPGGMIVLLETMGTGTETPRPPQHLMDYFSWLSEAGFSRSLVRTDYRFRSLEEAVELSTFFFGEELGQQVRENNWMILPECTGIWWRKS